MIKQIFVNLPVKDLNRTVAFFTALGFTFNPQFTDENATCMIMGENIFAMLLVEPFFKSFIDTEVADGHRQTEVLLAIPLEDRAAVDALIVKVKAAGGTAAAEAKDYGFMYQHPFRDLDGHHWEPFVMDGTPPAA